MSWDPAVMSLMLHAAALFNLAAAWLAWTRRTAPGAKAFSVLLLGMAIWCLGYSFQLSAATLPSKTFWLRAKYLGIQTLPLAWLAFAWSFCGRARRFFPKALFPLALVPAAGLFATLFFPIPGPFFSGISLVSHGKFLCLHLENGPFLWVNTTYAYLLIFIATGLLVEKALGSAALYRTQTVVILAASLLPWLGNVLWVFRLLPHPGLDLTPFSFTVSGLLVLWALYDLRVLGVLPVARRVLMKDLSDALVMMDDRGVVVDLNPAAEDLLHTEAGTAAGKPAAKVLSAWPETAEKVERLYERQEEVEKREEGGTRFFDLCFMRLSDRKGRILGWMALFHETTKLRRVEEELRAHKARLENLLAMSAQGLEEESEKRRLAEKEAEMLSHNLRQAQKMEAIGTLAGGIAHDFNNILSPILGYSEMVREKLPKGSLERENMGEILASAHRAKELVAQILAFGRQAREEIRPVDCEEILWDAIRLLRATLPATISVKTNLDQGQVVNADATHIHQVAMNLCTNAFHAMRERGGVLSLGLATVELAEQDLEAASLLVPGKFVCLTVSDTGHGMTPDVVDRIFDPYFTTKNPGEGTGLGLSVVHGIVSSYGGDIRVESEPEKGTRFRVYFPSAGKRRKEAPEKEEFRPIFGHERILLVDDEPSILKMTRQMLERLGYQVSTRSSSVEAWEAFLARPDKYDLVLTDMTMPHLTGDRLAKKILSVKPDVPVVLCTGYSEGMNEEKARALGASAFVLKPIVMDQIGGVLRKALEARPK